MKNKYLLKIILLLSLATPRLFADITQAQVDEYLKVSWGGQVLNFYQNRLSLAMAYDLNMSNFQKDIFDISKQKRFVHLYNDNFMKLESDTYEKIIQFYMTKVGLKSVKATLNFSSHNSKLEAEKIKKQCKNISEEDCFKYINLEWFSSMPKEKKRLIKKISKNFNIIKIKRNLMKKSLMAMNFVYKKKYRYSDEFIEKYSTYNNPNYDEITKNIIYLSFQDFSELELKEILNYVTSKAGKKEFSLINEGITKYTNEFIKVMFKKF